MFHIQMSIFFYFLNFSINCYLVD